ncbi:methionyl-tRNA synthetase [Hydrogenispora ethanolica]|uniref:Methionine--tRNA ligase n=2 Tax=Hydrogenispora ethanolica TaxID=1082276 RepID=A0A4R1S6M0_HYDET|nr:methionyl-tRNA synthetase [Hydrogenispora ethanolica]
MGKFYLTTPIYYPSDNLHIGHAYTTVVADALARYHRQIGDEVWFLTGTDEHGQKIQRRAEAAGVTPQAYVDGIVANIKQLWQLFQISNDDFIRTTEERHERAVQQIFDRLYQQGDIYKSEYQGWYCTPCEAFWLERQLQDGKCPDCGREVELVKEESYFFRMSKYADRLIRHIEEHPEFIQPVSRKNEMVNNFLKPGLEDLCVSRTTFSWGIPITFDPKHVIYVWLDALSNYITALGYPEETELFRKFWPAELHLVGKEIVRFHTIYWPIILMALGLPLPKQVFGHGWLVLEGGKMSKSKGNVIDPAVLIAKYGLDPIRYYLLREIPFGSDGSYTEEALILRTNQDLANDLGNLLHRSLSMIEKFNGGVIPTPGAYQELDQQVIDQARQSIREMSEAMAKLEVNNALIAIFKLVSRANKYIDEAAPWALAKQPDGRERLHTVLYTMAETLRLSAVLLVPFLVETPGKIWNQLGVDGIPAEQDYQSASQWGGLQPGTVTRKGNPIFPRIEDEKKEASKPETPKEEKTVTATPPQPEQPGIEQITIEDFARIDLRVAKVLEAERVEKSDKLLRLKVKVLGAERQIVAGIAQHYQPEQLVGKEIVVVANLKPAKLRGLLSEGMLLAASNEDGKLALVRPEAEIGAGAKVR